MFSKMLTKILVPYDGSKYSVKALTRATELAHNLDSEIILFSVVNVGYISPPGLLGIIKSKKEKNAIKKWSKSVKTDTEKMLKIALKKCESKGITASYVISEGEISSKILDFASKKKISLIVIGSHGLHGIGKLKTLGSVSRRVSENAKCPVLIVR
ncbi:MAG: universal stress protein [Nitrosopumilaceae archaeon]|uniref:Universal stress protein n=3 Tax=Candidatus Nitrosomaritimum aestuariumsis TaxID=3342354 RepID=A0AC60W3B7_9ARCH|nr:universal stress protein [Nitrosopumilaceae archaeon]MBA4454088.1 universal stress protein [Nitrosopumilaceae archaeon]MBA4459641.1 universal stress protein [Nitrosopumilaceae archaeon]MBA4461143.1 universal stress protein [Nitrosopumilaceae archaeon]MBA4463822.1 universal stress protein [Nitrosopumilaceae archaeon]